MALVEFVAVIERVMIFVVMQVIVRIPFRLSCIRAVTILTFWAILSFWTNRTCGAVEGISIFPCSLACICRCAGILRRLCCAISTASTTATTTATRGLRIV